MNDLRPLLEIAARYRAPLALASVLMLFESAAALAVPWLGGVLTGVILKDAAAGVDLKTALLVMLGVFSVQSLLNFATVFLLDSTADRMVSDLKIRLYDRLQSLPLAYFHRHRLGDTLALLTTDVYVLSTFVSGTAVNVIPLLATAAGAVVMMFGIRPDLALLAAVLVPLSFLLMKIAGRRLRPIAVQLQQEEAGAVAIAEENLSLLPAIKTFTRERQESARYRDQISRVLRLSAKQRCIYSAIGPLVQFFVAAGIVLVLALVSGDLADGRLSPAQLVSFLLYAHLLAQPVEELADLYGQTQNVRGALARLNLAMAQSPEPPGGGGFPRPPVKGEVEFHRVSFNYEGRTPALVELDLRIGAGETIALVGPNGAGKSTLAHLLMRLHEPATGRITVDGIDIATLALDALRSQIGIVPQNVLLFHASVRYNIAYGRPEPDQAAIESAARAAGAHEFIVRLPEGYDTVIGDRGVRISGGQQQRLALARALLKDPPILILDEATATFDPEGEAAFLLACREAFRRRTVIFITHGPASLAAADRVVRLENGRLVQFSSREAD